MNPRREARARDVRERATRTEKVVELSWNGRRVCGERKRGIRRGTGARFEGNEKRRFLMSIAVGEAWPSICRPRI